MKNQDEIERTRELEGNPVCLAPAAKECGLAVGL